MAESRNRQRIRKAVESRGYAVLEMEWEPIYNGGEMSGLCGGWTVTTDAPMLDRTNYGDEFCGLNVEDVLADIDCDYYRPRDCSCYPNVRRPRHASHTVKGDPQQPLHETGCRWFIAYRLPWWPVEDGA